MFKNQDIIDKTYSELCTLTEDVYEFIDLYNDYIHRPRDYGNGIPIKKVEVHTLTMIEQNPSITVSELSKILNRTKGTVSVNVSALEKAGYIYREKKPDNAKVVHLYATPSGIQLSTYYKANHNLEIVKTQAALLKYCTESELNAFYKVIRAYIKLLEQIDTEN